MSDRVPRVSIGLPTFNGERYLAEALGSLLGQDFEDLEVIVADNASTDDTRAICEHFAAADRRVSYLPSAVNRGASWNFNRVPPLARGTYFKWAADDDTYDPGWVGACVEVLDVERDVVVAFTQATEIDAEGRWLEDRGPTNVADLPDPVARHRAVLFEEVFCYSAFGLIRADALRHTGLIGAFAQSDRVLLADLAVRGRFVERSEPWFRHREHPGRSMHAYRDDRDRLQWFDTTRDGSLTMPRWRLGAEYGRSLLGAADLPLAVRLRAGVNLVPWGVTHRQVLARELARSSWRRVRAGATRARKPHVAMVGGASEALVRPAVLPSTRTSAMLHHRSCRDANPEAAAEG